LIIFDHFNQFLIIFNFLIFFNRFYSFFFIVFIHFI